MVKPIFSEGLGVSLIPFAHLHDRVGADDPLAEFLEPRADLGAEDVVPVVDRDPAHPPAGHEVPLGQAAAAEHGHRLGEAGDRHVLYKRHIRLFKKVKFVLLVLLHRPQWPVPSSLLGRLTLVGEDEVVVDLVGDDGEAVAVGDLEDGGEVLGGEDGPARVRRVVHDDGHGFIVNLKVGGG